MESRSSRSLSVVSAIIPLSFQFLPSSGLPLPPADRTHRPTPVLLLPSGWKEAPRRPVVRLAPREPPPLVRRTALFQGLPLPSVRPPPFSRIRVWVFRPPCRQLVRRLSFCPSVRSCYQPLPSPC